MPAHAKSDDNASCQRPAPPEREYYARADDYRRDVEAYYGAASAYIACLDAFVADAQRRYEHDLAEVARQYQEERDAEISDYQYERQSVMEELRRTVDEHVRALPE
ncbi:MAG: hypothetical protein DI556_13070 [Rhodovulum sulfidophilum]|uniref:Uncharacterized protein n=1 Tax=Rhodovulum sulfidophilum TaxID=35806 RepID=A0A2W5Q1X7_RHOSU|nr:MAG: hypothetical protein DI556_13070 [Rhodovulum sulfidophilum]